MEEEKIIKMFSPEVRLHSNEQHFPASVDWLLERVSLNYFLDGRRLRVIPKGELNIKNLVERYLAGERSGVTDDTKSHFYLDIASSETRLGEPIVNGLCTAACYAHIRPAPLRMPAYDIQYWFFYPYNSMQNYGYGTHEGDWEHITVRITSDYNRILGVFFSAHKNEGQWWDFNTTGDDDIGTNHPIVYSAFKSHASYPKPGRHKRVYKVFGRDVLPDDWADDGGARWKCWEHVLNLGEKRKPHKGQTWIRFSGIWGGNWATGDVLGDLFGEDLEQPSPHTPSFKRCWQDDGGGITWPGKGGTKHDTGNRPAMVVTNDDRAIEIHNGGDSNNLFYNIGQLRVNNSIRWVRIGQKYDTGDDPAIAIAPDGRIIEIHNDGKHNNLHYSIGRLDPDNTIHWIRKGQKYDTGNRPAITITPDGRIIDIHNGGTNNNLYYSVGRLESDNTITWLRKGQRFDTGDRPAVTVAKNGHIVEIHNGGGNNSLYYGIGRLDGNNNITWITRGFKYDTGDEPTLTSTADGRLIEIHNGGDNNNLYYRVGVLGANNIIEWSGDDGARQDTGDRPTIAIANDGRIIEVHNGGDNNNLYYRIGQLA